MDLTRGPTQRMSKEMFVESVLNTIIDRIDSREDKRRLLNEIWICAQQHLADKLDLPWSPQGVWNRFVKRGCDATDTLDPRASELLMPILAQVRAVK